MIRGQTLHVVHFRGLKASSGKGGLRIGGLTEHDATCKGTGLGESCNEVWRAGHRLHVSMCEITIRATHVCSCHLSARCPSGPVLILGPSNQDARKPPIRPPPCPLRSTSGQLDIETNMCTIYTAFGFCVAMNKKVTSCCGNKIMHRCRLCSRRHQQTPSTSSCTVQAGFS